MIAEILHCARADGEVALAILKGLAEQDAVLIDDGGCPDIVLVFLSLEMCIVPPERHTHKLPPLQSSFNVL